MISVMLNDLQHKAAQSARRAALGGIGLVMICLGVGFLTAAAWLVLSEVRDSQFAALIIGMTYLGLGVIALALSKKSGPPARASDVPPPHAVNSDPEALVASLAVAFYKGFRRGKDIRKET